MTISWRAIRHWARCSSVSPMPWRTRPCRALGLSHFLVYEKARHTRNSGEQAIDEDQIRTLGRHDPGGSGQDPARCRHRGRRRDRERLWRQGHLRQVQGDRVGGALRASTPWSSGGLSAKELRRGLPTGLPGHHPGRCRGGRPRRVSRLASEHPVRRGAARHRLQPWVRQQTVQVPEATLEHQVSDLENLQQAWGELMPASGPRCGRCASSLWPCVRPKGW